jgi:short-subunit dehydrogenase
MSVVISGATGGVGLSVSNIYASKGHSLVLLGRDKDKLNRLCIKIKKKIQCCVRVLCVRYGE